MDKLGFIQKIALYGIPVLFAITVHEVAHGWVANKLGDKTAKVLGRLTLNPIKHIDLFGTIIVPGLLLLLQAHFLFGWAKPVPVNFKNLKNPKRDMAIVAAAGPISNFIMAFMWAGLCKIGMIMPHGELNQMGTYFVIMGQAGIFINIALMVLNIIPIPPLDGSRVVTSFLSPKHAYYYNRIEPYGFFILLGLIFTGILWTIMQPLMVITYSLIAGIFGLNWG